MKAYKLMSAPFFGNRRKMLCGTLTAVFVRVVLKMTAGCVNVPVLEDHFRNGKGSVLGECLLFGVSSPTDILSLRLKLTC